jgi:hypothetical protein
MSPRQLEYYKGVRMAPYDLIREGLIALVVVGVLVVGLAAFLSSPDEPPLTAQKVATTDPVTFLQTALGELDGSDDIASYGPPYNQGAGAVQSIGPISLQRLMGVQIPIDPARDDILRPLGIAAQMNPGLASVLNTFTSATQDQRTAWLTAYGEALKKAKTNGAAVVLPDEAYGPVAPMLTALLGLGRAGLLEAAIDYTNRITTTDNTRSLLFLQASALPAQAERFHLEGSQWGMMNETGNYPGQAWLWLYTVWYQVPLFADSPNADALVWLLMAVLSLALLMLPWIPGLNRLPRWLGVYRLIWRDHYRERTFAPNHSANKPAPGGD